MSEHESYRIGEREISALHRTRIFRGLSDSAFGTAILRGRARGARYGKGVTVAEADSVRSEFMVLLSGRLQGVREHEDGTQDFVQLFVPGEVCGLDIVCSSSRRCPFRLQTLDETDIVHIDYQGLFSGKIPHEDEQILRAGVTQTLATESLRRLHKIDVLYRRSLRDRISVFLGNLSVLAGSAHIEINMDREQFAQYLGVNRSALSHELALMREDGLIDFHKGSFDILREL